MNNLKSFIMHQILKTDWSFKICVICTKYFINIKAQKLLIK